MRSFFVAILTFCVLLGSLVSCNHQPTDGVLVTFDTLVVDTICPLFKNYEKPACHICISMECPKSEDASAAASVERFIAELPKDGTFGEISEGKIDKMATAYVDSYITKYLKEGHDAIDSYGEEMSAAATWMSYEEMVEGKTIYNADGFICYQVRISSYTGGAHGNTNVVNGVLDMKNGTPLCLADLFSEASLSDLNNLVRMVLVEQNECETIEELISKEIFFSVNDIEVTENFYVNEAGITWLYDPYDIAPYVVGEVSVTLPWDKVYPLLSADSPVMGMANHYTSELE